jgi:hypothetical protein
MEKIHKAVEIKKTEFQDDADESMRFFDGPHDFMYSGRYATKSGSFSLSSEVGTPSPTFRMSTNKVAEAVQLFGPVLYHRNPHRQVNVRQLPDYPFDLVGDPQDPQAQQYVQALMQQESLRQATERTTAGLLEYYLNYTPNELDLQWHARQMVDETIIKGMGLLWTEVYRPHGSPIQMVGSFYDSVDNLVIDPDMESIRHAKWIARRRVMPRWEVERRFRLPKEFLKKGDLQSANFQAEMGSDPENEFFWQTGVTNDLYTFWEVYSRMGLGHLMSRQMQLPANRSILEKFGPYIYLAVSDQHPWPLNLPESVFKSAPFDEAFGRVQWPTPFWADPADPWPCSISAFHERPRKVWPMSHFKPAMGELKFLNWAFSFLAGKVKNTSRDFVAILKSAGEEIKTSVLSGRDLTLLEIEGGHKTIAEVVQFLQHPEFKKDIWDVISAVMGLFERRVGLNELMYGESSRQLRSAQEAHIKGDQIQVRPDDMAMKVEATMTKAARKEALACRWHLVQDDVLPILGAERARLWGAAVMSSDIYSVVHELEYRIEAGAIRKPNKQRDMQNANNAVSVWGPVVQNYMQVTGDVGPMNFLIAHWCKANDIEPFQLQPPPPPQPDTSGIEQKEQEHQQVLEHRQQDHELSVQQKMEQHMLKQQIDSTKHGQDLSQDEAVHIQDLTQDQQEFLQELLQARQEGAAKLLMERRLGEVKLEQARKSAAATGRNGKDKSNATS